MDSVSTPPTHNDVERETMKRTMNVTKSMVLSHMAWLWLKFTPFRHWVPSLFDKLLIMLGHFHKGLAFYGEVGISLMIVEHIIITESDVLAEGLLMGFIHVKYYGFMISLLLPWRERFMDVSKRNSNNKC